MKLKRSWWVGAAVATALFLGWSLAGAGSEPPKPDTTKPAKRPAPEVLDRSIDGPGTPEVSYPDTLIDFGKSPQHQSLTHVFKVLNVGDAPLKLLKASAG